MKVSYHNGRVGNPHHNDRTFDLDKAPHVDQTKTHLNKYVHIYHKREVEENIKMDFATVEKEFYKETFSKWLEERNTAAEKARHPERRKTTDDLLRGRLTRPEETILQIGNIDDFPDDGGKTLMACYNDWTQSPQRKKLQRHCHTLDMALHLDESTPHIHERHLWMYEDHERSGVFKIGQEEALKRAGYELPFPDQPEGQHNNRKMVYDAEMRELWYDICEQHGIHVDRKPQKRKHMSKEQYIEYVRDQRERGQQREADEPGKK